ncbi:hypothetical protein CPLU01_09954 [Colletotrichum plurivorum]|uniref:C2H2-type domain-containing protein n=1 Tax=Colletotrichum plurivorum TaxID=2175906 RepID=A0A8H6NA26_9PEZI|nr:hypothetical protein CPLU01_09954 [Colletotrichum plurivorum]
MGQVREEEDATADIYQIARKCFISFDRVNAERDNSILSWSFTPKDYYSGSARHKPSPFDFLGPRNGFLFWVDYTGALSYKNSSLDERLRDLPDVSSIIIKPAEDDATELTISDDAVFRDQVVLWVRHRLPAARKELCQQLGDSIVVRRRMILQRSPHSNRVAKRRERDETQVKEETKAYLAAGPGSSPVVKQSYPTAGQSPGGWTMASRPDPKNRIMTSLLRVPEMHAPPHAPTPAISTISTRQDGSLEYPPAPVASKGATSVQCPYCLRGLELREDDDKVSDHVWRRHVDEHVQPYPCLFPECAESLVFFSRPHDWKTHMESAHLEDWMRKVHAVVWCCNLKHKSSGAVQFETELEWRKHYQDVDLHPDKSKPPSEAQMDASSPRSQRVAKREEFVCPLCEQIPDKIKPLVGEKDAKDIHGAVLDHVAGHLRSLSLMAVPSFEKGDEESPGAESELVGEDSFKRFLNENSIPQPPSGREEVGGVSLPAGSWPVPLHDISVSSIDPKDSLWDKDFGNYKPPDGPQSLVYDEKFEGWIAWRSAHNPFPSAPENDPILMHFKDVQGKGKVHAGWFDVDDWKSLSGRTQLSFAAETGNREGPPRCPVKVHEAVVKLLLDLGVGVDTADQKSRRTPRSWAAEGGHNAIVELLLSHGANVEAVDPESNQTPLSLAAENGSEETVKVLLAHKCGY